MTAPFTVRRSSRALRARLTLTGNGAVVVVLPLHAPSAMADEMVGRHARWIGNHQRKIAESRQILDARPALGEGRTISLRGVPHDVVVEAAIEFRRSRVDVESHSPPSIIIRRTLADRRSVVELVEAWLRRQARADVEQSVAIRSVQMGVKASRISVRDQRSRWGSASRRGTLSFSWRLVLCPPEILDYVVVHELAHLRWAGHGVRFWSLVRRHAPAADHYRRWLRQHESGLRHALD